MDKLEFVAVIKDTTSAIKIDGGGNGGEVVLQVPELSMPDFLKLSLYRAKVLKVTVEEGEG